MMLKEAFQLAGFMFLTVHDVFMFKFNVVGATGRKVTYSTEDR
jgi:hypothetical protein